MFTNTAIFVKHCLPYERESKMISPKLNRILENLGENIKLARLRRKLSAQQVSGRADISREQGE